MPYIPYDARNELTDGFRTVGRPAEAPGELNFIIANIIDEYLDYRPQAYHYYNEVIGVLECLKLELYRRFVGPYEDKALSKNGEVFVDLKKKL